MELQTEKFKVDISTTPRQNSLHGTFHPFVTSKAEGNSSFRPVKVEDYENLFQNGLL